MKFKDQDLPKRVCEEIGNIFSSQLCVRAAQSYIRVRPNCPPALDCPWMDKNEASMRALVKAYFAALPNLEELTGTDNVREMLVNESLYQTFTIALSEKALVEYMKEFAVCFGEPAYLLALLLDERDGVRAAAFKHLARHPERNPWEGETQAAAAAHLTGDFENFLSRLKEQVQDKAPKKQAPGGVSVGNLIHDSGAGRIEELQRLLRRAREDFDAEHRLRKKEHAEFDARLATAQKKAAEAENEYRTLHKNQEKDAKLKAAAELEALVGKCFAVPPARTHSTHEHDLEERITTCERILGHAHYFKARLEEAAVPVPAKLTETIAALSRERDEHRRHKEAVMKAREMKETLRRLPEIFAVSRMSGSALADFNKAESDLAKKISDAIYGRGEAPATLGELYRARKAAAIIIDGDNLLNFIYNKVDFAVRDLGEDGKSRIPYKYRNRLIGDLRGIINQLGQANQYAHITLYHDRAGAHAREKYGCLNVVWSGGEPTEKDKADKAILSDLRQGRFEGEPNLFLITDDRTIQANAKAVSGNIRVVAPDDLREFINSVINTDVVKAFKELIDALNRS